MNKRACLLLIALFFVAALAIGNTVQPLIQLWYQSDSDTISTVGNRSVSIGDTLLRSGVDNPGITGRSGYLFYEETFDTDGATVTGWTETETDVATALVSNNQCLLSDTTAAGYAKIESPNPALNWGYSYDRSFIVEADVTVADTGKFTMEFDDWGKIFIGSIDNSISVSSADTGAESSIPTSYSMNDDHKIMMLFNPATETVRFYLGYSPSADSIIELSAETTFSFDATTLPTTLYFISSGSGTGSSTIDNIRVYVPGGVLIGDSIAAGHPNHNPVPGQISPDYPRHCIDYWLSEMLTGFEITNQGLRGGTLSDVATRTPSMINAFGPDYVFIFAGTNDITGGATLAQMQSRIQAIVAAVDSTINVVIYDVLPKNAFNAAENTIKNAYNAWLPGYIDTVDNAVLIPVHDLFEDSGTADNMNAALSDDNIHPNLIGYQMIATETIRVLTGKDQAP
jgi:lysophospholipase L1-like esterase